MCFFFKPFSKRQILDSSKLEGFAHDNFKFDENARKFTKRVGKTLWEKEKLLVTSSFSFSHIFPQNNYIADT